MNGKTGVGGEKSEGGGGGGGGERIGGKKQDKYRGEKKGTEEKPKIR